MRKRVRHMALLVAAMAAVCGIVSWWFVLVFAVAVLTVRACQK